MTAKKPTSEAKKRRDARDNRERILAAARAALSESGGDASMAEISRRAGVGMATLYRNFAGRKELLEALYSDEIDAVCEAAATLEGETPGATFFAWLERFFDYFTSKRQVADELLAQSGPDNPVVDAGRPRVMDAARPLLLAAQESGEVRTDLTLEQILDMVIGIAKIPGDPDYVRPILRAGIAGLQAEA